MADKGRIQQLTEEGYCCSQIIMLMGMEHTEREENPDLIRAVAGLCGGLHFGSDCGVLSGAVCFIFLVCDKDDAGEMAAELAEWFKSDHGVGDGSVACRDIIDGDDLNKLLICPKMMNTTFDKVLELLDDFGYEFG